MKSIRNLSEFARQNNISPQLAKQKRDNGYVFGVLDGKPVIYNPKSVMVVKNVVSCRFDDINLENYEIIDPIVGGNGNEFSAGYKLINGDQTNEN